MTDSARSDTGGAERQWSSATRSKPAATAITIDVPLWRSLRARTAAAIAILALALVLISGAVFAHAALDGAKEQLRSQAVAQLQLAIATSAFGGSQPQTESLSQAQLPRELVTSLSGSTISTFDDGTSMWAARRADSSGIISTKLSNAPLTHQWQTLSISFLWIAVAAFVISIILGWLLAGRLTRPLRLASQSVNDLASGSPVIAPNGRDEVAILSRGITLTAQALAARLDREKAFAADVAHDLRTPLTALVNASDLLDDSVDSERVRHQVARMRGLVADLLELSRAENDYDNVQYDWCPLGETISDLIIDSPFAPLSRIMIVHDAVVRIDVRRLARAIDNLLANAATHGQPPILVTVEGRTVTITDHGQGFPDSIMADGPRRFSTGGNRTGSGLGLAIALRHLEVMGATMTLRQRPDAGAAVIVTLPGPSDITAPEHLHAPPIWPDYDPKAGTRGYSSGTAAER